MVRNVAILLVGASLMAACATPYTEAPLASNFPATNQQKLQAAAHWQVVADDVAQDITAKLATQRELHLQTPSTTEFERGFGNQLMSALARQGHTLQRSASGNGLSVEIDTQVLKFSADRKQRKHTGGLTALATGVWALIEGEATGGAAAFALIAARDAHAWHNSEYVKGVTPQFEIIITTRINDGNHYLWHGSRTYYLADNDASLYQVPPIPVKPVTPVVSVIGGE